MDVLHILGEILDLDHLKIKYHRDKLLD